MTFELNEPTIRKGGASFNDIVQKGIHINFLAKRSLPAFCYPPFNWLWESAVPLGFLYHFSSVAALPLMTSGFLHVFEGGGGLSGCMQASTLAYFICISSLLVSQRCSMRSTPWYASVSYIQDFQLSVGSMAFLLE
ncbi:unnamed protein product [Ilex paraguariensis]|uniref:Uncharacterized protein n=1 Tax=Ilex paraguariensis TaxID=185542 RepID=A0ABC8S2H3_9AQUA